MSTASGSLHLASGIRVTPLYSGRNLSNHLMSALASSLTWTTPHSLGLRNRFSNRDTNMRPCLMHLHTKWSFPSSLCNSFSEVSSFVTHPATSSRVSCTLSGVTSMTIFTLSNIMRRNTILVAGAQALVTDSVNPSVFNKSPRNSKAHWALSFTSAAQGHQDNSTPPHHSACIYRPIYRLPSDKQSQLSAGP